MLKKALVLIIFTQSTFATPSPLPQPLKLITSQGGEIVDSFTAPAGVTGYIVDYRGKALTVYLSKNQQHIFTGKMLDATGRDMGQEVLEEYIRGPQSEKKWQTFSSSNWIIDGSEDAENVIYTFTDPNCPYCKRFWKDARPWVESGKVQIRHILVGILKADSYGKSAAILSAEDPTEALHQHEARDNSSLRPLKSPSEKVSAQLKENHFLMRSLGVSATPAIYYKDKTNAVKLHMGLPSASQLEQIIGLKEE
ncbi:thiol:disulfide interchange protein DsbG [Paraglaciecola chathamensis]|jgi:thiol:disulfide interchange protein DsbG|uniref:Thiol:disulfide interchange protein n=1 Tax=Paraglaciecola chathamensis TaxID=368405 RepID=A0A8H9IJ83_9ALTE|nr:thiol:disulfide interchange protein DsbG [Paraglaciecola oceanifecundans]AEE25382.1 disulfide isomerase/thiol-disulfide oxidase [Glaciecola sp. 4H-3-7+YE-5]GGZ80001.1 thiol:disulfide interchange protein DsbG [Paraglaciecola oceanifecundans]|tara:strand:- start:13785 stop:14540 length:756 start_codon:yes stop_codon:yes gene_type:complete